MTVKEIGVAKLNKIVRRCSFVVILCSFIFVSLFSQASIDTETSIHESVRQKNINLVKKLLSEGADPADREGEGIYFYRYALTRSVKEIVADKKRNEKYYKHSGWTALHWAVYVDDKAILELLVNESGPDITDNMDSTPLQWAAKWGRSELVQFLIEKKADVNHQDKNGYSPLHYVMFSKTKKNIGIIDQLIEAGADIFLTDKNGYYSAHLACQIGYLSALRKLLEIDGNLIYSKGEHGNTLLHLAAANGYLSLIKEIANEAVNLDEVNNQGLTALHWAALNQKQELVRFLVEKGASINFPDNQRKTILLKLAQWNYFETLRFIMDNFEDRIDFKWVDELGQSALHKAVMSGNLDVVIMLVGKVGMEIKDIEGETALQKAIYSGRIEMAKYLIENGASMNVINEDEESLLRVAVKNSDLDMVQLLVDKGAKVGNEGEELFELTKQRHLLIYLNERTRAEVGAVQ